MLSWGGIAMVRNYNTTSHLKQTKLAKVRPMKVGGWELRNMTNDLFFFLVAQKEIKSDSGGEIYQFFEKTLCHF